MKLFDKLSKLKKTEDFDFGMSDMITDPSGKKPGTGSGSKTTNESAIINSNAVIDLDSKHPVTNENDEIDSTDIIERQQPYVAPEYGIQETVELIHSLPDASPEVIIPVVIKTLESANINVNDIVTDAAQREEAIESRSVELLSNIEELESKISALNDEVMELNNELENIANVKALLLDSLLEDDEEEEAPLKLASKAEPQQDSTAKKADAKKTDPKKKGNQETLKDAEFNEMDEIDIDEALNEVNNIHIAQEA